MVVTKGAVSMQLEEIITNETNVISRVGSIFMACYQYRLPGCELTVNLLSTVAQVTLHFLQLFVFVRSETLTFALQADNLFF